MLKIDTSSFSNTWSPVGLENQSWGFKRASGGCEVTEEQWETKLGISNQQNCSNTTPVPQPTCCWKWLFTSHMGILSTLTPILCQQLLSLRKTDKFRRESVGTVIFEIRKKKLNCPSCSSEYANEMSSAEKASCWPNPSIFCRSIFSCLVRKTKRYFQSDSALECLMILYWSVANSSCDRILVRGLSRRHIN